jgi:hypothetical protein
MPTIMVIWVKDLLRFVPYITTTCAYKNSVNDLLTPLYDMCLLKSIYNKKTPNDSNWITTKDAQFTII